MEKKEIRPFTHRIFTDFSGDDGDPNTPGSSKCLCGAWVLSAEEDLRFNEGIVLRIKKLIGCKNTNELKYKSLSHHPKKIEALSLIPELKAKIIMTPVIKARIQDTTIRNPETKLLLTVIHGFPMQRFMAYLQTVYPTFYLQLIIDEMTWSGYQKDVLETLKQTLKNADWSNTREDWLYFAKSSRSLMMQIADVIAGLGREYIEDLQDKKLPPCRACDIGKWNNCVYKRKGQMVGLNKYFKNVRPLLLTTTAGKFYKGGFIVRPPEVETNYRFVECLK
jgi:hypothetical protein